MRQHNILMTREQIEFDQQQQANKPDRSPLPTLQPEVRDIYDYSYDRKGSNPELEQLKNQINQNIDSMELSLLEQKKELDKTGAMLEPAMRSIIRSRQRMLDCLSDLDCF